MQPSTPPRNRSIRHHRVDSLNEPINLPGSPHFVSDVAPRGDDDNAGKISAVNSHQLDALGSLADLNLLDPPLSFSPSKARAQAARLHQVRLVKAWLTSLAAIPDTTHASGTAPLPITTSASTNVVSSDQRTNLQHSSGVTKEAEAPAVMRRLANRWEEEYAMLVSRDPSLAADMLEYLQTLQSSNQRADERRRLLFEAQVEELARLSPSASEVQTTDHAAIGHESVYHRTGRVNVEQSGEPADGHQSEEATAASMKMRMYDDSTPVTNLANDLVGSIIGSLSENATSISATVGLNSLTASAVSLGHIPSVYAPGGRSLREELGSAVHRNTIASSMLTQRLSELVSLKHDLEAKLTEAQAQLNHFTTSQRDTDTEAEELQKQTAQRNREMKVVLEKVREYRERITLLERTKPASQTVSARHDEERVVVSVEDLVEWKDRVRTRNADIEKLQEQMAVFHGLPPDLEASRNEVKRVGAELDRLKSRRESLFARVTR